MRKAREIVTILHPERLIEAELRVQGRHHRRICGHPALSKQQLGRVTFDEAKRKAIYHEMEKVAIEEAPFVGLTWRSQGYAMRKGVTGFTNLPGALTFFTGETFETTATS